MKFKSPVFSQASGSIAGLVFSRNGGGMYVRARALPTNPNTAPQQNVRDAMRDGTNSWTNTLTDGERQNWNTYAFNTPTLNALGEATHKTGQQMYLRQFIGRRSMLAIPASIAPTIFDLGTFTVPGPIVADATGDTVEIEFNESDAWAAIAGGHLAVYQSRPQNPTRNFSKGPYLFMGKINGSPGLPTSPATFTSLFPLSSGQKLFLRFTASTPDGRLTNATIVSTIVV